MRNSSAQRVRLGREQSKVFILWEQPVKTARRVEDRCRKCAWAAGVIVDRLFVRACHSIRARCMWATRTCWRWRHVVMSGADVLSTERAQPEDCTGRRRAVGSEVQCVCGSKMYEQPGY